MSVVGQARVVHDLVLHDAAVIHEDSMIQTALLAVGFSLANTFFSFLSRVWSCCCCLFVGGEFDDCCNT